MKTERGGDELVKYIVVLTSIVVEVDPVAALQFVKRLERMAELVQEKPDLIDQSPIEIDLD
jgi:hypothetical protein